MKNDITIDEAQKKMRLRKYVRQYHSKDTILIPFICKWFHHPATAASLTYVKETFIFCTCGKIFCVFSDKSLLLQISTSSYELSLRIENLYNQRVSLQHQPINTSSSEEDIINKKDIYEDLENILKK